MDENNDMVDHLPDDALFQLTGETKAVVRFELAQVLCLIYVHGC